MLTSVTSEMFREQYADVFSGDERWKTLPVPTGDRFAWDADSTYIRNPPFFEKHHAADRRRSRDITGARVLALLGDSITTDHISPAGSIKKDSPAGKYLMAHGVQPADFNSYGARRGNHEVMMRGTFANIRLRNQLAPGTEGGWTTLPAGRRGDDDLRRGDEVQGRRACRWSSSPARNTARARRATGRRRARCCSASRGHRRELRAHPPQQPREHGRAAAAVPGWRDRGVARPDRHASVFEVTGIAQGCKPGGLVTVRAMGSGDKPIEFQAVARIDTPEELVAFRHGGILPYVLRQLVGKQ